MWTKKGKVRNLPYGRVAIWPVDFETTFSPVKKKKKKTLLPFHFKRLLFHRLISVEYYYYTWRSVRESLLASVLRWPGVKYRVELNVSSKWWLWRWVKRICPPLRVVCNGCKIFGKWRWWRLSAIAANRMAASWECGWDRKKGEATEADVIGVDKPDVYTHTATGNKCVMCERETTKREKEMNEKVVLTYCSLK